VLNQPVGRGSDPHALVVIDTAGPGDPAYDASKPVMAPLNPQRKLEVRSVKGQNA